MNTSSFINAVSWTVKILGSISMLILAIFALLFLGIMLGGIEPNGSVAEDVMRFLINQPLVMMTMLLLSLWAGIIFWKRK